jgi:6-phosphofructokinase
MTTEIGHASFQRRIAINVGAGYVPGMNAVIMGAALAAGKLGWEVVGIRDGFDGLLHPERYPEGGLVPLSPQLAENLDPPGWIHFTSAQSTQRKWLKKWTCPMIF